MILEIIGYAGIGILCAFLIFGMFWGMVRGFKKSLFRGIWLVVIAMIMFFLTPTISSALFNINLDFLGLVINGEKVHTIYETAYNLLTSQEQIADVIENNPEIIPLIEELIVLFLNTIMFPILFWITKIVTWPIWAIISVIIFKRKKIMVAGKKKVMKTKKYRFLGAMVGAFAGVIVMTITMMPVNGTIKLIQEVDAIEYHASENGEGIITSMLGAENMQYIDAYNNTVIAKAMKYTGITGISNGMYNFLSTKKINDQKVVLSDEVKLYVTLYNDIEVISKTDFENLDKTSMSIFLNSSENLLRNIFSSKVLKIVGDDLIVYAIDTLEKNGTIDKYIDKISIEQLKQLALESVDEIKLSNVSTLQQDLLNTVFIAKSLNDNDILIPTLNKQLEPKDYLTLFTDNVIDELANYMFNMPSVKKVYPIAMNKALSYVGNLLGFEYVEKEFNDENMTKTEFANILKGGLGVVRTLDFDSKYKVTKQSLEAVGSFLDIAKELYVLEDGVFDNIVTKLFDKGESYLNNLQLNEELKSLISLVVGKVETMVLNKQTLLKQEFKEYGVLFDEIKVVVEEFTSSKKTELTLKTYGALLDKLNKTDLFENIVADVIDAGWDMVKDKVANLAPEFTDISTIIETIKDNIGIVLRKEIPPTGANVQLSLEKEFENLQNLYDFFIDNFQPYFKEGGTGVAGLTADLFSEENTILTNFGAELDVLSRKEQLIISNEVVRMVISQALKVVKDEMIIDTTVQGFIGDIITNIETYTLIPVWADELNYFKKLANSAETGIDLETIGTVLDSVYVSKYIGNSIINKLLNEQLQIKYEELSADIKNQTTDLIIAEIKTNISAISGAKYNTEIAYLLDVLSLIASFESNTYIELGQELDTFNASSTIASVRPLMIKYAIEKAIEGNSDETALDVLNQIKSNVDNTPSVVANNFYERELTVVESIKALTYPTSKDDLTRDILSELGVVFYTASEMVFTQNIGQVVINIIFDYVEYEDIADILTSIKENITADNGILAVNKKSTSKPSDVQLINQTNYVACFTNIYDLINIYEEMSSLNIDMDVDGAVLGAYLDSIASLTIIDGEDKTLATDLVDELNTTINSEISRIRSEKYSAINASALSEVEKAQAKATVDAVVNESKAELGTIIANTKTEITNKTVKTYAEIFGTLTTQINALVDAVDSQLESY